MKNLLTLSFFILFLSSCSVLDREEDLPSFLQISEFNLTTDQFQGSESTNISEVNVSLDGQTIGLFELPATVPILAEGDSPVRLTPIIKQNGISTVRLPYPFYTNVLETIDFSPLDTVFVAPEISYTENSVIWSAEFDTSISLEESDVSEGQLSLVDEDLAFEDGSAFIDMDEDDNYFLAFTEEALDLPSGQPVYLELDYAANHPFTIGIQGTVAGTTAQATSDLVIVLPTNEETQEWSKIYVNLTNFVSENSGANEFEVYLEVTRSANYNDPLIYFDNLKVVY